MSRQLEACPECHFTLIEKTTYCPYCGFQLTQPTWKKVAAWFILILIIWGLVKCHVRLFQGGLDDFFEENAADQGAVRTCSIPAVTTANCQLRTANRELRKA